MLALSIRQPWASMIILGHKTIENRSWDTKVRGEILIHAGQEYDYAGHQFIAYNFPEINLPHSGSFQRGGIIGKTNLEGVITESDSKWFFGKFGFVLSDPTVVPFKPVKGQLSFFEVKL